jgi:hypothetical protein
MFFRLGNFYFFSIIYFFFKKNSIWIWQFLLFHRGKIRQDFYVRKLKKRKEKPDCNAERQWYKPFKCTHLLWAWVEVTKISSFLLNNIVPFHIHVNVSKNQIFDLAQIMMNYWKPYQNMGEIKKRKGRFNY